MRLLKIWVLDTTDGGKDVTSLVLTDRMRARVRTSPTHVWLSWLTNMNRCHDYQWQLAGGNLPDGTFYFEACLGPSIRMIDPNVLLPDERAAVDAAVAASEGD